VNKSPEISVILPVHNGEKYIKQALDSILNQTHHDFECIVLDDGSIDRTQEIIKSYHDHRILYLRDEQNQGLVYQLNKGLNEARSEFVVRMDGDDICTPTRFEEQLKFLKENENVSVVGSNIAHIDEFSNIVGKRDFFYGFEQNLNAILEGRNSVRHPAVMYRKSIILKVGGYKEKYKHVEDLELWFRLYTNGYSTDNIN